MEEWDRSESLRALENKSDSNRAQEIRQHPPYEQTERRNIPNARKHNWCDGAIGQCYNMMGAESDRDECRSSSVTFNLTRLLQKLCRRTLHDEGSLFGALTKRYCLETTSGCVLETPLKSRRLWSSWSPRTRCDPSMCAVKLSTPWAI